MNKTVYEWTLELIKTLENNDLPDFFKVKKIDDKIELHKLNRNFFTKFLTSVLEFRKWILESTALPFFMVISGLRMIFYKTFLIYLFIFLSLNLLNNYIPLEYSGDIYFGIFIFWLFLSFFDKTPNNPKSYFKKIELIKCELAKFNSIDATLIQNNISILRRNLTKKFIATNSIFVLLAGIYFTCVKMGISKIWEIKFDDNNDLVKDIGNSEMMKSFIEGSEFYLFITVVLVVYILIRGHFKFYNTVFDVIEISCNDISTKEIES